jgi:hypothetical protein
MTTPADLVERFRRGSEVLAEAVQGVSEAESGFSPAPGKWTIREIVGHLADTEIVAGMRLRQIIAEDKPTLVVFDQDAWAKELGYAKRDVRDSLATFRTLRAINALMLQNLPPAAFDREGHHPERGVLTARDWVVRFSDHVDSHAKQITAIREAWAVRAAHA